MVDGPATIAARTIAFGPFRFLPAQQLLLEGETPVRLGSRALEVLTVLVEHPGEVIDKAELIARVWPNISTDENTLRVHVAGLRRALGDGQPGRRYVANVPGRGYRFVAPVELLEAATPPPPAKQTPPLHNLPVMRSRIVGRAGTIDALSRLLPQQQLITIVGAGGIGKTTVALAVAEALLPEFADGACFVDLAPVEDPQFVSTTLGSVLGIAVSPQNATPRLVEFLRDKRMLILLDNCERVVEAAAALAEQILAGAPGVRILATSREPLRAEGERVHRLLPLEVPQDHTGLSAAEALAYPAIQLFVERAAAILDGFELTDADASAVSAICGKLGGIALAIELAAARTDAFGIQQLELLLDDRFRVLNQGKRTAQPRHRSLAAALDWSYEFLPESERLVLRRLSVFAGDFTLEAASAITGDGETDVVEDLANLVAKSLVSADVSGPAVQYRLLDTTRAYASQKLSDHGEINEYARRHALHHLNWFRNAQTDWQAKSKAELRADYERRIDDVRAAADWALSPAGDIAVGAQLMAASAPLWLELTLLHECRQRMETALARLSLQPSLGRSDALRLRVWLGLIIPYTVRPLPETSAFWSETHALAEELDEIGVQAQTLTYWSGYCMYAGGFREALGIAERCAATAVRTGDTYLDSVGHMLFSDALHALGHLPAARHHAEIVIRRAIPSTQRALFANRTTTRAVLTNTLWLMGFPDQAFASSQVVLDEGLSMENDMAFSTALMKAVCPIALLVGDLEAAERSIEMLLERSARSLLDSRNHIGRCFKGALLLARGDFGGLNLMRAGLTWLREARFNFNYARLTGVLAEGLASAGLIAEAQAAIDDVVERAEKNEELSWLPELLRIKGEITRLEKSAGADAAAEAYFQRALTIASKQEALSWELRAATSMARLWSDEGKTIAARKLLCEAYGRFTEGFDTLDLRTARTLIDALRAG